jgi:hypothetical protein
MVIGWDIVFLVRDSCTWYLLAKGSFFYLQCKTSAGLIFILIALDQNIIKKSVE